MSQIPEVGSMVEREGDVSVSVCTRSKVGSPTVKSSLSQEKLGPSAPRRQAAQACVGVGRLVSRVALEGQVEGRDAETAG